MAFDAAPADRFLYDSYEIDPALGQVTFRYSIGERHFFEQLTLGPAGDWASPAVDAAARLVFLLAGVSYFKTSAPKTIDLGDLATTAEERKFLKTFYFEGLGEFAYRNDLDLSTLEVVGPDLEERPRVPYRPVIGTPLVPFGGGIDSIVTTEAIRDRFPATALFIVSKAGDRFEAIDAPAATTGLPVVRAERELDPAVVYSSQLGYLNGHVPVTGIISAMAVLAAVLGKHDAVVMSNEWSASVGNLIIDGRTVNHQWSKSLAFERAFRSILAATYGTEFFQYFSLLRPYSELWVAKRFAALPKYHRVFRSCNRAFHIDRAKRLDHWCGTCDKCCFIDLILSPFLEPSELSAIFAGKEPLEDPALEGRFRALLGNWPEAKPFECVGDVDECRAALRMAAERPGRADSPVLKELAAELGFEPMSPDSFFRPMGEHCIPDGYTPEDQLV
jgi:hypothetical protein